MKAATSSPNTKKANSLGPLAEPDSATCSHNEIPSQTNPSAATLITSHWTIVLGISALRPKHEGVAPRRK